MSERSEVVAVVGLGYVGLPLALCFAERGTRVIGVDVDEGKATALGRGQSYLRHIPAKRIAAAIEGGRFTATTQFAALRDCTAIVVVESVHLEHVGVTMASEPFTAERVAQADAVLIATAHRCVDYRLIAEHAQLVVDTRDAMRQSGIAPERLVRA